MSVPWEGDVHFDIDGSSFVLVGKLSKPADKVEVFFCDEPLIMIPVVGERFKFKINGASCGLKKSARFSFFVLGNRVLIRGRDEVCPPDYLISGDNGLDVLDLIRQGMVLTKKGGFVKEKISGEKKIKYVDLYKEVAFFLHEEHGLPVHVTHGTLLGLIRERDFIDGDDDFDVLYLSGKASAEDVVLEREHILNSLKKKFSVSMGMTGHLKVKKYGVAIDLMPAWHEDGFLNISSFTCMKVSDGWDGCVLHNFLGRNVSSLSCYIEFLEHQYGKCWQVPDSSYRSKRGRKERENLKILSVK